MRTLPLTSGVEKEVETSIGNDKYVFTTKWNERIGVYTLDIKLNGVEEVHGARLLFGEEVLKQHISLPLGPVYAINKIDSQMDFEFDGLDVDKGLMIVLEPGDLGG